MIGKPIGIVFFAWIAVKTGVATLPRGVAWTQISGAALLGGIGFTMAIFVTGLAFVDASLILQAKIAILVASLITGVLGFLLLRFGSDVNGKLERIHV